MEIQIGEILFHADWQLIVLGMIIGFSAFLYLREMHRGDGRQYHQLAAVAAIPIGVLSLLAHELAHGYVANNTGLVVREGAFFYYGAKVFLEYSSALTAKQLFFVALAGSVMNLAIALVLLIPVKLRGDTLFETLLQFGVLFNLGMFAFNLVPILGLDGYLVLLAIIWEHVGKLTIAMYLVNYAAAGIIGAIVLTLVISLGVFLLRHQKRKPARPIQGS